MGLLLPLRVGKLKHPINKPGFVEKRVMHYPENKVAALISRDHLQSGANVTVEECWQEAQKIIANGTSHRIRLAGKSSAASAQQADTSVSALWDTALHNSTQSHLVMEADFAILVPPPSNL
ncbi:hypothetical protein S7711_11181 [Stachybotrys chartarum IBT 7711]|uniref:Uncharacterized protein n=1 Tax=Stachybotrys chartarum (strain CBS 109288 / IBT 7711) TaxID=1280523 RepID=A0A084AWH1_STACB|nr:hypothetical protein S7711_11181 [Stachybotrys chartarum IBT 7711]KFA52011.1 hypothetical protein S40293_11213 [Stachybotrys chartarum IBT 40293]